MTLSIIKTHKGLYLYNVDNYLQTCKTSNETPSEYAIRTGFKLDLDMLSMLDEGFEIEVARFKTKEPDEA